MMKTYNLHHLVPKSLGGSNNNDNIVRLDTRHHTAHHMLFQNDSPREQLGRIINLSSTALTEEVKSDIIKILSIRDMEYWYKPGIYK